VDHASGRHASGYSAVQKTFMRLPCVFTEDRLIAQEVVNTLIYDPRREWVFAMLRTHISGIMENRLILQLVTQAAMGAQGYADLKDAALQTAIQYTEELAVDRQFNALQAEAVKDMLNERLASQPSREFQDLMRPIFREDEWILVASAAAWAHWWIVRSCCLCSVTDWSPESCR
jgi:hypothetical protein